MDVDGVESEEGVLELALDGEGRIAGTTACGLRFGLAAFNSTLATSAAGPAPAESIAALIRDCEYCFTGDVTFWLPADRAPRFALERLVSEILQHHLRGVDAAGLSCGAEWWVQVRRGKAPPPAAAAAAHPPSSSTAETGAAVESIGFHWDKDETLVDEASINVHPQVSTVTYLSDHGAPTLILEERCSTRYDDGEQGGDEDEGDGGGADASTSAPTSPTPPPSSISRGYLCFPEVGKHVTFDGRWLHGAPAGLARRPTPEGEVRVSLLVNVWVGHEPLGADLFPEDQVAAMGQTDIHIRLPDAPVDPLPTAEVHPAAPDTVLHTYRFGACGWETTLTVPIPTTAAATERPGGAAAAAAAADDSSPPHVIALTWPAGQGAGLAPTQQPALASVPELDASATWADVHRLYQQSSLLIVRGACPKPGCSVEQLRGIYTSNEAAINDAWNLESASTSDGSPDAAVDPEGPFPFGHLLGAARREVVPEEGGRASKRRRTSAPSGERWYSSFVLNGQEDGDAGLAAALAALPFAVPPFFGAEGAEVTHSDNVWFFFGRNTAAGAEAQPLEGRPEHTDKLSQAGTWHLQLNGTKRWFLRPDEHTNWPSGSVPPAIGDARLQVDVAAGDLLILNTRLWYHATELPPTTGAFEQLSFSFARDFHYGNSVPREVDMANVEEAWATSDIKRGDVVAEASLPAVGLSDSPNCEIQVGEDGTPLLVAIKDIRTGQCLTVAGEAG